jgi:uncharacterized membrane protein YoaT (DUF817 family)
MLAFRLETLDEAKVIVMFHIVGTIMEVFKTAAGSWIYPEAAIFRIGGVPLFSGFLYASIGSYIARSWRLFDFRFTRHCGPFTFYPPRFTSIFSHIIMLWTYASRCSRCWHTCSVEPGFTTRFIIAIGECRCCWDLFLVASFIWFAENFGTLTKTWIYPNQMNGWVMVPFGKLSAWILLMSISYVMVAWVNRPRAYDPKRDP